VSAARALALAWDATCEGYGSLALLAAMARSVAAKSVAIDVVTYGGHGELFFQAFDALGQAAGEALSLSPEAAAQRSNAALVTGDAGADLIALRNSGQYVKAFADAAKWPLIAEIYPLPPSPVYVRGPDAKLPAAQ
jgi:tRNA threonylcarbamoyladenosine biosynthesis protein TsaB